jgi:tetratricopeptide (TPR) repeat protein
MSKSAAVIRVAILALLGFMCGGLLDAISMAAPGSPFTPERRRIQILPHHIPKSPNAVTLRFAMVNDVIHERFPRHGRAYYEEGNRQVRRDLAARKLPDGKDQDADVRYFGLIDDLGAGLDYLGQNLEAARLLRDKLKLQQELGLKGPDLYTTYANLGTFLSHAHLRLAQQGDVNARKTVHEGVELIRKSIEVNPQAHFGREIWQAVLGEFLEAAFEKPEVLVTYDFIGDRWDGPTYSLSDTRPYGHDYIYIRGPESFDADQGYRDFISRVGAEGKWQNAVKSSHHERVAFDEPTLGIIGIWRLGSGANPHFALAIGEIMLRVGQRYIAWCAYERAVSLEALFWPDIEIRQAFVRHCRARQQFIENQIPAADRNELRPRYEKELQFGKDYQTAYQEYEATKLAAGAPLDDPHFYEEFHKKRGPIATPVGKEDKPFVIASDAHESPLAGMVLGAGAMAFLGACLVQFGPRMIPRRQSAHDND